MLPVSLTMPLLVMVGAGLCRIIVVGLGVLNTLLAFAMFIARIINVVSIVLYVKSNDSDLQAASGEEAS